MDLCSWCPLAQDIIQYDQPIDHEAFFLKVQSVNRRLAASAIVSEGCDEFHEVIRRLPPEIVGIIQSRKTPFEIRKLLPKEKNGSWHCFEISFEDISGSDDELSALFFPVHLDKDAGTSNPHVSHPYAFGLKILNDRSAQFVLGVPDGIPGELTWLRKKAYPALLRWVRNLDPQKEIKPTNRLINVESFHQRYVKMKKDYGFDICKRWLEKTDPQKYVYEDCGIACYLLETWARTGSTPKYFVDIGCGNGLLVGLLNWEGVQGVGLDIRARKVWNNILSGIDLREETVDPTINPPALPKGCDYLIGNHSDELTPWIPVMAARMRCEFFLLPCCPYDFHGKYTARPGKLGSSYAGFLEFVRYICRRLGYVIEEDRLSIPSSKRLCIVGKIPAQGLPSVEAIEQIISDLTVDRSGTRNTPFVARPKKQEVRNCANIPKDVAQNLTTRIFNALLEADSNTNINGWRCGGAVPISEMIKILTPEEKSLMKQQDGGFQTFLKNQYQAFHVYEAKVHIRNFNVMKKKTATHSFSKCWMQVNHPDGCPYGPGCKFIHE